MSGYEQFVNQQPSENPSILFELEIEENQKIDNTILFLREFLSQKGFKYTGVAKGEYGYDASFNDSYIWDGAVQDGNKLAVRIRKM